MVAFKYNAVRVFDHKIRTPSISNTLWIMFYLFVFLGSLLNALRFALLGVSTVLCVDRWFEAISLTFHGLSTLALSMALNHQRRFRSSNAVPEEEAETDPLLKRYDHLRRNISALDVGFMLLFVVYDVMAWVAVLMTRTCTARDEVVAVEVFPWVFVGLFLLQRIPPLVLTGMIIFCPPAPPDQALANGTVTEDYLPPGGPSTKAKVLLGLATLFSVSGDVPLSLWKDAFGDSCVFWIGSGVDLVHLLYVIGLILYFAFLRSEYLRNMEEAIWGTVTKFQQSFDFRKF
jgi:hypothetical protein